MSVAKQVCIACALSCCFAAAQVTGAPSPYPYLLRLEHSTFEAPSLIVSAHSCALLQNTGAFHLESGNGDDVKVFEGVIATNELQEIEGHLNSDALVNLAQQQIEEPLIRTRYTDELQVTIFRGDHWQDLFFRSSDSQQPFNRWLQPLVHWLDGLHKLPHRELSEDEGENRCLPPKVIALKKRDANAPPESVTPTTPHAPSAGPAAQPQLSQAPKPQPVPALLRVHSFERKMESAHESCVLIVENGNYRFEDRTQKTGKPVNTEILGGQITADELQQLRQLLEDPALAKIKHREPPGGMVVSMMGEKWDISISRPAGVQHLILSSRFNRPDFPSFYSGDADVSNARPLLKFLSEHVASNKVGSLDRSARNGCSEAP